MKQLKKGIKVESEHSGSYNKILKNFKATGKMVSKKDFYKSIAKEHLKEDKQYYSKLKKYNL